MSNLRRLWALGERVQDCSSSQSSLASISSSRDRVWTDGLANMLPNGLSPSAKDWKSAVLCGAVLGDDGDEVTDADDVEPSKPSTGR
jgi:hypothetical protein